MARPQAVDANPTTATELTREENVDLAATVQAPTEDRGDLQRANRDVVTGAETDDAATLSTESRPSTGPGVETEVRLSTDQTPGRASQGPSVVGEGPQVPPPYRDNSLLNVFCSLCPGADVIRGIMSLRDANQQMKEAGDNKQLQDLAAEARRESIYRVGIGLLQLAGYGVALAGGGAPLAAVMVITSMYGSGGLNEDQKQTHDKLRNVLTGGQDAEEALQTMDLKKLDDLKKALVRQPEGDSPLRTKLIEDFKQMINTEPGLAKDSGAALRDAWARGVAERLARENLPGMPTDPAAAREVMKDLLKDVKVLQEEAVNQWKADQLARTA